MVPIDARMRPLEDEQAQIEEDKEPLYAELERLDEQLAQSKSFWKLIEEGQNARRV